nr:hypothetical protein [uncultured Flavobacterium sp.]
MGVNDIQTNKIINEENLSLLGLSYDDLNDSVLFMKWKIRNMNIFVDVENNCICYNTVDPFNEELELVRSVINNDAIYFEFMDIAFEGANELNEKENYILKKLPKKNKLEYYENAILRHKETLEKGKKQYYNILFDEVNNKIENIKSENSKLNNKTFFQQKFISDEAFECFMYYSKTYINKHNFCKEYGYLKKRMEHENLIHHVTDNDFVFKLLELNLIDKAQKDYYFDKKGKFESLGRYKSKVQIDNFDKVFCDLIKPK